jgi:aspartate-semialdehyde dehydrogenase
LGLHYDLPSRPNQAIHIVDKIDVDLHLWSDGTSFSERPEPSKDLKTGMAVVVGDLSVEGCTIRFSAYSHNTVRGAAGGVVYLAEFVLANTS